MESTLLAVPDREGSQLALKVALEDYIQSNYQQNVSQYSHDCAVLADLRSAAIDALGSQGLNISPLLLYYSQLNQTVSKFPNSVSTFVWRSSLGYSKSAVESSETWFDALNVLYNAGARYTQEAVRSHEYKAAFQFSQAAAGIFDQVSTGLDKLENPPPLGLDKLNLDFLKLLCLAQAQECFWANQRQDNKGGNSLSAKLASGVYEAYKKCAAVAAKSTVVKAEWVDDITAKIRLFEAISHYRQAMHCLEKGLYGEQVARLQTAEKILSQPLGEYTDEPLKRNISNLKSRVSSDCRNAEKENDLLYLQAIPSSVEPPKPTITASPKNPEIPPPKNLFTLLLPFAVYQAPAAYSQRLKNYVQEFIISELERINDQTKETFRELGLPASLENVHQPDIIPPSLLREAEAIQNSGGVEKVQQFLDQNLRLAHSAKDRLNALPPGEEVNNLKAYVETATKSDAVVQDKIEKSKYLVGILNQGSAAISIFLPHGEQEQIDKDLRLKAQNVAVVVDQLEALLSHRLEKIQAYDAKIKNIDFSGPIHEFLEQSKEPITEPSQLEPVYNSIVTRFDHDLRLIDHEKIQVEHLLTTLRERITALNSRKAQLKSNSTQRQQAIDALQAASHQYGTIKSNLKEGREFYNALLGKISALEEQPVAAQWTPDMPIKFG